MIVAPTKSASQKYNYCDCGDEINATARMCHDCNVTRTKSIKLSKKICVYCHGSDWNIDSELCVTCATRRIKRLFKRKCIFKQRVRKHKWLSSSGKREIAPRECLYSYDISPGLTNNERKNFRTAVVVLNDILFIREGFMDYEVLPALEVVR